MKECDNSKIHISSNFILSISLLIMFDTLLQRPSLHCNTPLHFTTLYPTTLHYTSLHFATLHHISLNYISLHFTQLHFTTLHPTTLHYTLLPLISTSLPSHLALRIYISYRSIFVGLLKKINPSRLSRFRSPSLHFWYSAKPHFWDSIIYNT